MSGLFGVLDVASRGILVTQQGLRTTSHNIANVNTEGYSKQRQVTSPTMPHVTPDGAIGTGVEQVSVERISDTFTQSQIVDHNAAMGSNEAQAKALGVIEEIVNEQRGEGLTVSLDRLYDAFSDLASAQAPGASVEREALRGAAEGLIDTLHGIDSQLRDLQTATHDQMARLLPEINDLSARIAELNRQIVEQETLAPANDLRDQRDLLVRTLAGKIDVQTFEQPGGAQVVYLPSGMPLVEGTTSHALVEIPDVTNPFDPGYSRIGHAGGGSVVDVTDAISGGELGGLLRTRDVLVPSAIRSIDTIAYNLVESVNAVHQGGVGLDGTVGDFFGALPGVEDAARDIAIAPAIQASTDAIAAGTTTAPGDNTNALLLAQLRDRAAPMFLPGDPPGPATGPSRSVISHAAGVVADIGQQSRAVQNMAVQQEQVSEMLMNRRDALSGVSIDEEVTQLITLQAAFQANARVVDTVNRLLQDVIALV